MTYLVLCGLPPFNGESEVEIIKKVKEGRISFANPIWAMVSNKAKDFISALLTVDVDQRLNARDALQHPFMQMGIEEQKQKMN